MFIKTTNKISIYFRLALLGLSCSGCTGLGGLHSAAINGDVATTEKLINKNADVNKRSSFISNKNTPLVLAAMHRKDDVAKILIENGADVNAQNLLGWSALMYASRNGSEGIVKLLVERGADVNTKNREGRYPLFYAAFNGREKISNYLIENGADVNAVSNLGFTPLMIAATKGYYRMVDYYIQKGADVNAINTSEVLYERRTLEAWASCRLDHR